MRNGSIYFGFLFSLLFFNAGSILKAQAEADAGDLMALSLDELLSIDVTSASKFAQKINEAPSVISVITQDQINQYAWRSINDILYKQPGFGPGQDFDRQTVPTRGLADSWSSNHILHLVDGIPMNDNLYGTAYTWEITPLVFANNLEIIRGPGSALYGSNATNGVVQVNTLSAADMEQRVRFRTWSGSDNTNSYDLMASHVGSEIEAVMSYSTYNTDGNSYRSYDGSGRTDDAGNLAKYQTRNERSGSYLFAKLQFKKQLAGLTLQFHEQAWSFETGHGWLWWVPDYEEDMSEKRRIVALKYHPVSKGKWDQEYVVRFQRHQINWNQRYYTDRAFDSYYPSGMWEYLDTHADDLFVRTQFSYDLGKGSFLLAGLEMDRFIYNGDDEHYSNINVDDPYFPPFPDDRNTHLGPWLDFIVNEPLVNRGIYAQYFSGDRLGSKFKLTLGVRSDTLDFDYHAIYEEGRPTRNRSFSRISPRIALVYLANEKLTFKLMSGKAFRAPTPTELAGAHTFSLASNIEELQPELIDTIEAAMDWMMTSSMNLRANYFRTKFENQIAYSTANNNLSTNVFSQETQGIELELLYQYKRLSGFVNLSYVDRIDETVLDETIAASPDQVAWEPEQKVNFGVRYNAKRWNASLAGHMHGSVQRRASEVGPQELPLGVGITLDLDQYRPQELRSWLSLDAVASYSLRSWAQIQFKATNLLDEKDTVLVKSGPFPFDYQQGGRKLYASLSLSF